MTNKNSIEKFIKRMGMKITVAPFESYNNICITLKVRYKEKVEYWVQDCFEVSEGKVDWRDATFELGVKDGIFAYLGDDDAVDNYFLDITTKYAQNFIDQKIKSS